MGFCHVDNIKLTKNVAFLTRIILDLFVKSIRNSDMNLSQINSIYNCKKLQIKQMAVLVDPDKSDVEYLDRLLEQAALGGVDFFFVGGSFLKEAHTDRAVMYLKKHSEIPVLLFPGSPAQVSNHADGILLLSLISGRNPDLLIGRHVEAAPKLLAAGIEILPTGYMLIDGGRGTSVSYISHTLPIPADKEEIAAFTALAGVQLGLKLIYLDAGSGALYSIPSKLIRAVRKLVEVPIIVGGGIRSVAQMQDAWQAGADIVVVGNAFEKNPDLLRELAEARHKVPM
jgi:putative glycerol-1-phosphate prenyltransferase